MIPPPPPRPPRPHPKSLLAIFFFLFFYPGKYHAINLASLTCTLLLVFLFFTYQKLMHVITVLISYYIKINNNNKKKLICLGPPFPVLSMVVNKFFLTCKTFISDKIDSKLIRHIIKVVAQLVGALTSIPLKSRNFHGTHDRRRGSLRLDSNMI